MIPVLPIAGAAALAYTLHDSGTNTGGDAMLGSYEVGALTSTRGTVIPLSAQQRANRARYLGGIVDKNALDSGLVNPALNCAPIYYRLKDYNGGKDPHAPDPATRWVNPATEQAPNPQTNVTCDCVGGAAWCGGFDRFQPARFSHLYGGWINTDSMIMDAQANALAFAIVTKPYPGCFVVCRTDANVGHIGVVIDVPGDFDPAKDSWSRVKIVDVAARGIGIRANMPSTAASWQARGGVWIRPLLTGATD